MVSGHGEKLDTLQRQAHQSARKASPVLVALGRFGYAAEGVVYTLIGVLAVQVALGRGGATTDNRGALTRIAGAPFGRTLLIAMLIGILGYALWRFVQALLDTDNKGSEAKGIATRIGYAATGVVHIGLALSALRLLQSGNAGPSSESSTQTWTATLLSKPFGQVLVGIAGLAAIGAGGYQIYKAYKAKFREQTDTAAMSGEEATWYLRLGRIGYTARGFVFATIGLFLIVAARTANPEEAHGLDGALALLAQQRFGPWLLGAVAVGFVAYGLFLFAEARYRRMVIS